METSHLFFWDGTNGAMHLSANTEIALSPSFPSKQKRGHLFFYQDLFEGWGVMFKGEPLPVNSEACSSSVLIYEWNEAELRHDFFVGTEFPNIKQLNERQKQ
jgi:hypothetical protein